MALLADEELAGKASRKRGISSEGWKDIGYYIDENGRKRFGVIPKKQYQNYEYDP
jgi:hypothetical protein